MRVSAIANAALVIEADLKNIEKRLLFLKKNIAKEAITNSMIMAEIDKILEIVRA